MRNPGVGTHPTRREQIDECLRIALNRLEALEAPTMPARKSAVRELVTMARELLDTEEEI